MNALQIRLSAMYRKRDLKATNEWEDILLNYMQTFAAIREVCIVISVNVWIIELCAQFRYIFEKSCLCSLHLFLSCLIRFLFSITYQRYSCREIINNACSHHYTVSFSYTSVIFYCIKVVFAHICFGVFG